METIRSPIRSSREVMRIVAVVTLAAFAAIDARAEQLDVPAQFATIQGAINAANPGDVVLIAPGNYAETLNLLGKQITLRGSGAAVTTLDGTGLDDSILTADSGETLATVVEGLTFTNGPGGVKPNCISPGGRVGGAVYVRISSLTIRNCRFLRNGYSTRVTTGGAIYVAAGSSLHVEQCDFQENGVGAGNQTAFGGAIMGCQDFGDAVAIHDSTFTGNTAAHGGAVRVTEAELTIVNATFTSNTASHGGGVSWYSAAGSSATIIRSVFSDNEASFGAGANITTSTDDGIGVATAIIDGCAFRSNRAGFGGGLFGNVLATLDPDDANPSLTVLNSTFTGNAAMPCCNVGIIHTFCFQDGVNWGTYYGGGADIRAQNGGVVNIANCLFADNSGTNAGGLHIASCAETSFGAEGGTFNITNVTAVNNTPDGIHLRLGEQGDFNVANSIVRNNTGPDQIATLFSNAVPGESTIDVTYSNVQGGFPGAGNIDADPLFVGVAAGDYRLQSGSPSIDAGDNAAVPTDLLTDLDGNPRFADDPATPDTGAGGGGGAPIVDMGAYEFTLSACTADLDGSGDVDVFDLLAYLDLWFTSDPAADIDGAAGVDVFDLLAYLDAWFAGC